MTQPKTVASFRKFKLWRRNPTDSWLVCHGEYDTSQLGHAETIHVIEYGAYQAVAEIEHDFQLVRKQRDELTQRNQELVEALKEVLQNPHSDICAGHGQTTGRLNWSNCDCHISVATKALSMDRAK